MMAVLMEGLMGNLQRTFSTFRGARLARLASGLLGFASLLALSVPAAAQGGGKFLDAKYCSDALNLNPGSNYDNGSCQLWKLLPPGPLGYSRLQLKRNGKFLDAKYCTDELNMNPGSNYDGGSCQLWKLVPGADGWSRIQIKRNGKVLQAQNCADDVQLGEISDANGGAFQLWRLVPVENSGGWSRLQIKCTGGGGPVAGGNNAPAPVASGDGGGDEENDWNGDTYGWYDDGWDGPGWYIVGYEFRNGFGFGGREGWHGWHHHGSHHHGGHHGDHHGQHGGGEHGGHEHHGGGGGSGHHGGGGGGHHFAHHGGGGGHHGGGGGGHRFVHRGGGGGHHGGGGGHHGGGGGGHHGGGGGGGHHGGGRRSDIRLKHDIVLLGRLDNGLGFYRFSYNGSDKAYVGVIAQEVQAVKPQAVVRGRDGYLRVYYDELGLRMQSWDEWVAGGRKIPAHARGL
jgi:Ricin-type beta-trefoil lectin domain-like/Chaperone of endosialidase